MTDETQAPAASLDEGRQLTPGWPSPLRLSSPKLGRFDVTIPEEETLENAAVIGDRFRVPRRFTIEVKRRDLPLIDVVVESGEPVCDALRRKPGGPSVTPRFKVVSYVEEAFFALAVKSTGRRERRSEIWRHVSRQPGGRGDFAGRRRRRARLDDDHYRRVADVYREALAAKQAPVDAVAVAIPGSRSSAGRWVMEARRRGHLPETTARRAKA